MKKIVTFLLLLFVSSQAWAKDVEPPSLVVKMPQVQGLENFLAEYERSVRSEFLDDYEKAKEEGAIYNLWSLDVEGVLVYQGKFLALSMQGYDYRGGAHGMPYMEVMYFDSKSKKALNQSDILMEDSYQKLSEICRQDLAEQGFDAHDDWMLRGTEAVPANYELMVPRKEGLEVVFRSYQVASYAAGTPSVTIPWTVAWELFREEYRP